eukprot:TRINITY_DN9758_c0_g1_i4.p1 TRINITY_DN9758_c0_g1~~TRINITY_DN9758_c0_g1_i4.p1  ORF type:complete len:377 (+),score=72.16 TRINITY_DN9758_c0_g1_i4:909-2039(+)
MLAKAATSPTHVKELLQKLGNLVVSECKYDGERTHLHFSEENLIMYTRSGEQQNEKYKELHREVNEYLRRTGVENCVLDGEIIALDGNGRICPFQEVGKKFSVSKVLLKVVVFDILWYNNAKTIDMPLLERKKLLDTILKSQSPIIEKIKYTVLNLEDISFEGKLLQLFDQAKSGNCEGLIIKTASAENSKYEPSTSRRYWTKVTPLTPVAQTSRCFSLSGHFGPCACGCLLGQRQAKELVRVFSDGCLGCGEGRVCSCLQVRAMASCRVGTGMSDELLEELHDRLKKQAQDDKPKGVLVNPRMKPDCWLEPSEVWEIGYQDFTLSPIYDIGRSLFSKGISLRFPKFIQVRTDKSLKDLNTTADIIDGHAKLEPRT